MTTVDDFISAPPIGKQDMFEEAHERMVTAEKRVAQWKRAVEGLTPGGSEFADDPERCAQFIKDRCDYPPQIIELRARVVELEKVFKEIAKVCKVAEFTSPRHALYKFQDLIGALTAIKHGIIIIPPRHSYGDYTQKKITTLQQATEYAAEVLEQVQS